MYVANIIIVITHNWETGTKMVGHLKGMILKSYKSLIVSLWEIQMVSLLNSDSHGLFLEATANTVDLNSHLKA